MRRTLKTCAGLVLGSAVLCSVGCQSTGWGTWGSGSSYFSNWRSPWSSGADLASSNSSLPSSSATPSQPYSSVTSSVASANANGQPAGASATVASNWGSGYPLNNNSSTAAAGPYGNANSSGPAGYSQPSSPYGNAPSGYGTQGGSYDTQPVAYQQQTPPPASSGYQTGPYDAGTSGSSNSSGGGYNTGSTYNTNGGGGYSDANSGYGGSPNPYQTQPQSSTQVQPPVTGYQPLGSNDAASNRGGGYQPETGGYAANPSPPGGDAGYPSSGYAAVNAPAAAMNSGYQVQPASAQEPVRSSTSDYDSAAQPEMAAAPPVTSAGVLPGGALPASLNSSGGGYRPGSVGSSGQYTR